MAPSSVVVLNSIAVLDWVVVLDSVVVLDLIVVLEAIVVLDSIVVLWGAKTFCGDAPELLHWARLFVRGCDASAAHIPSCHR